MKSYKIIHNEEELKNFIEWLPDLKKGEVYFVSLFARKKYDERISFSNHSQIKRFTSSKEMLFNKIKQLECPLGSYRIKGVEATQQSLVLYINPNPRCLVKASKNSLISLAKLIANGVTGYNPQQIVMSEIHKSKSYTKYIDFDFDLEDDGNLSAQINNIIQYVNEKCGSKQTFLRTRGGLHALVDVNKVGEEFRKSFYNEIVKLNVDATGDNMIPIPGTIQGGHVPHFISGEF